MVAVALGALIALALAGCGTATKPSESRPDSLIHRELVSIPGVTEVSFLGGPNGLPDNVRFGAHLTFAAGTIPEVEPILDYLLAEIWSDTETHPTAGVLVSIDEGDTSVDLEPAATSLGLQNVGTLFFTVSGKQMAARYGAWPGRAPVFTSAAASPSP